jgi:hypothetical protein
MKRSQLRASFIQHRGKHRRLQCQWRFLGNDAAHHFFAHILAWCNDRVSANAAQGGLGPSPARDVIFDARWPDQAPDLARHSYDAGLQFRRMAALQIDRDELASDDPLLFRELQGLCTLCRSKERCVLDLAQERDQPSNPAWREYCPNAATLNVLGAVQNCSRAARHLKTPHSTGHLG